jgi:hypothetical protein
VCESVSQQGKSNRKMYAIPFGSTAKSIMKVKITTVLLVLTFLYSCIATVLMEYSSRKAYQNSNEIRKLKQINEKLEMEVEMYAIQTDNI